MDDLDNLLADLGRPAQHEHETTTVNMSELDSLMNDLNDAAHTAPAVTAGRHRTAAAPAAQPPADDLDALLSGLDNAAARPAATPARAAAPAAAPAAAAAPAKAPRNDLDDLLRDLDSGASKPPVQQPRAQPQAAPAPAAAAPVKAAPPAAKPNAVQTDDLDDLLDALDTPAPRTGGASASAAPVRSTGGSSSAAASAALDDVFGEINASSRSPAAGAGAGARSSGLAPVAQGSGPSRGVCANCNQQVFGEVLQSMGKLWHPQHFVCGNCQTELGTQPFYEYEGQPHCEKCYRGLFCPRCAKCDKSITDRIITALGKKWHPDCFTCSTCNQPFPGGSFFEREGYPYCSDHFYTNAAPQCGSCGKAVRGECTNAMNKNWHPDCFVCHYCRKAFTDGAYFEHQGLPYCKLHYHANTGSVCAGCNKAITGRSVNAMGKNWHPEHFVCAFCVNPLGGGNYTEKQGKPYCKECHNNLFG